ncbi:Uncharacterized protein C12G12.10 [Taphrina deformans PYCC 5710]|uniref:Uncharacterized protein C12G12.10 n=1 Tax=Taphrina deformans (strain PYCC 5710 / ATCC 11124 / CBS 356.35 / IMI 108563 / JCM 9778 / NBRC 8474) TaxID=1097556 RepID=R4XBJ5_TAPDE|nr:Uncharacterized protein C12G12.10 [Taphrina deformans PYCC 5710]|eukprot:CCG83235.1 Uncharacterized protein C12G12.10 [Taphrina deformans PYCC 5710]
MSDAALQNGQRDIPGFYYDQTRKRYFKVAHTASGGQYTASSIAKRHKSEKAAERAAELSLTKAKNAASRRHLHFELGNDMILKRSIGCQPMHSMERLFAHHLHRDVKRSRLMNTAGYRTKFAYNAESSELYVAASRFIEAHSMNEAAEDMYSAISQDAMIRRMMPIAPLRSAASSLTFSAGTLVGTSVGEGHRPAEVIIKNAYGGKIATVDGTLWCSAVRPGSNHFAAGGSTLLLYDIAGAHDTRHEVNVKGKTDIMSMDFLDANILALGCRNGSLQLHDIRTKSPTTSVRFHHGLRGQPSAIASVRSIGPQSLVIAGLQHSLNTYDIRFLRSNGSLVSFHDHRNDYDLSVNAMAICNQILAVAQENNDIKLWKLDGENLTTLTTEHLVDDLSFPNSSAGQHDTLWSMSYGRLEQWHFDA